MWRFLRYALTLSVTESLLVTLVLLLVGGGISGVDELRLYVLFLGVATLLRVLINVPLAAFCMAGVAARSGGANRIAIAVVNCAVYCGLIAPMFVLSRVGTELPLGFVLFAVACLVSPFIPWIKPPYSAERPQATPSSGG